MESINIPCKFQISDPVTLLMFTGEVKQVRDPNTVSESINVRVLPLVVRKATVAFSTIRVLDVNHEYAPAIVLLAS